MGNCFSSAGGASFALASLIILLVVLLIFHFSAGLFSSPRQTIDKESDVNAQSSQEPQGEGVRRLHRGTGDYARSDVDDTAPNQSSTGQISTASTPPARYAAQDPSPQEPSPMDIPAASLPPESPASITLYHLHGGVNNRTSIGGDQVNNQTYNTTNNYRGSSKVSDPGKLRKEIRKWLRAPEVFSAIHQASKELRTENTGAWFLHSEEFQKFVEVNGCVLWCTGKPGSGKTVLASTSITELQKSRKEVTIYAYLRYSEQLTQREILAALLDQLLAIDKVVVVVAPSYRQMEQNHVQYTAKGIVDIMQEIVRMFDKVNVVVDGLDEASDDVKDGLLRALVRLNVNLLIFSRPLNLFTHHTPKTLKIDIQARTGDITLYIREQYETKSRLNSLLCGRHDLAVKLSDRIKEQADGMFLLAKLQLQSVICSATNAKELFELLAKLPSGIDEMYRLTLERISSQDRNRASLAHRLFIWLLHRRDDVVHLGVQDIQHALAVCPDTYVYNYQALTSAEVILDACHGLVIVQEGEFRLVHYSTKEYLRDTSFSTAPNPHAYLSATCIGFLASRPRAPPYSLSQYAEHGWGYHAQLSQHCQQGTFLLPIIQSFLSTRSSCYLNDGIFHLNFPVLFVSAALGLVEVIKSQALAFPSMKKSPIPEYTSPFHIAAARGQFEAFLALMETYGTHGVALWAYNKNEATTILEVISQGEESETVPFLKQLLSLVDSPPTKLRRGLSDFNVNDQNGKGKTALIIACEHGHADIVRLLISRKDIQVSIQDYDGRDAFYHAASRYSQDLAQLLLSSFPNLDVERPDRKGFSAFMVSCWKGHADIVREILKRRPDRRARLLRANSNGETALSVVVTSKPLPGHKAIVCSLLRYGSQPPFLQAVAACGRLWKDSTQHVDLLLSFKPSLISQRDINGRTALILGMGEADPIKEHEATSFFFRSGEALMSTLLFTAKSFYPMDQFLDFINEDCDGFNAFYRAAHRPSERLALLLLSSCPNLDVERPDDQGYNAFLVACHKGHAGVVREILAHRPDRRARLLQANENGKTPLSVIVTSKPSQNGMEIVQLLLEYGAEPPFLQAVAACLKGPTDYVMQLLTFDPSLIAERDGEGQTALMLGVKAGGAKLVSTLISAAESFFNPAHFVKFVNACNKDGRSVLAYCSARLDKVSTNSLRVVKLIMECPVYNTDALCNVMDALCSISWSITDKGWPRLFPLLYDILKVGGWDAHRIRKAVLAAAQNLEDILICRLLLEDWVTYSFIWSQDELDTSALLEVIHERALTCDAPAKLVEHHIQTGTPAFGIEHLALSELAKGFCNNENCIWHNHAPEPSESPSKSRLSNDRYFYDHRVRNTPRDAFISRRAFTTTELERIIGRPALLALNPEEL